MIFSAFRKPKCVVCKRTFSAVESVKSNDSDAMQDALALSQFGCGNCGIKFHGMCGKIGQANPKSATVTCPRCNRRIKHELPFDVEKVEGKTTKQIGDRVDDELSDRPY